ncbi:MAG: UvrD-helicase domain-containing protein [Thermoplasmata archaeon]
MNQESGTNTIIIANPGTGKTTQLAKKVVELLKMGVKEEDLLCITFTNKAELEMKKRISDQIRDNNVPANASKIAVHTFHSYALDYLTHLGFNYELVSGNVLRYSIYKYFQENKVFNYSLDYIKSDLVPKTENAIRYLKSFGITAEGIDVQNVEKVLRANYASSNLKSNSEEEVVSFLKYFTEAFKRYESEKSALKDRIDYADMLIQFVEKYNKNDRYRFVLVDELQDLNELEAEIARLSGTSLFLVGDPKQAIFGFQGGSLANFKCFETLENMKKEVLYLNYRSLQPVLNYAKQHFIKNAKDRTYEKELAGLKANRKEGAADVKVYLADDQINSAIKLFLTQNFDMAQKTAIITRTNAQLLKLSAALDAKGIEYNITASSSTSEVAKTQVINYLRGMLYDDRESIINALFTPYSGLTLKETFQVSENRGDPASFNAAANFFKIKHGLTIDNLKQLFDQIIFPVSFQLGKDHFLSARSIFKGIEEYLSTIKDKSREGLFDYISLLQEDYEPIEKNVNLVLTTVHKAKGMEFDNVIYIPSKINNRDSFIDLVVYSIIKATKKVDVKEELDEEPLRVDFVAFTRAKNRLYVVASSKKESENYRIEGFENDVISSEEVIEPDRTVFDEAYSLFLNRRYGEAINIQNGTEPWLLELIKDYFSNIESLSYSMIESLAEQMDFLKSRILKVPEPFNAAMSAGSRAHELAFKLFKNTLEFELSEEDSMYLNNIKTVNRQLSDKYKARQIAAELELNASLKYFCEDCEDLRFKAKLDAVYETTDKKHVILDYKTDKTRDYASEHRRQLAVYKRIYSVYNNVPEPEIYIALGFIALKGKINTGTITCFLDDSQDKKSQLETFKKHLEIFMKYKKEPVSFVKDILNKDYADTLDLRIVQELKKELDQA